MPGASYSDINTNVTPAPAWRFTVTFPANVGFANGTTLSYLVQRISGSQKSIEIEPVIFESGVRHFPTGWSVDNLSITFAEDVAYDAVMAFRAWMDLVIDNDGNFGLPSAYVQQISLQALDPSGNVAATFTWPECIPVKLDGYDWDGTQTVGVTPTLSVAVNSINAIVAGTSSGVTSAVTAAATTPIVAGSATTPTVSPIPNA